MAAPGNYTNRYYLRAKSKQVAPTFCRHGFISVPTCTYGEYDTETWAECNIDSGNLMGRNGLRCPSCYDGKQVHKRACFALFCNRHLHSQHRGTPAAIALHLKLSVGDGGSVPFPPECQ
jgi:hypothetical protein